MRAVDIWKQSIGKMEDTCVADKFTLPETNIASENGRSDRGYVSFKDGMFFLERI